MHRTLLMTAAAGTLPRTNLAQRGVLANACPEDLLYEACRQRIVSREMNRGAAHPVRLRDLVLHRQLNRLPEAAKLIEPPLPAGAIAEP